MQVLIYLLLAAAVTLATGSAFAQAPAASGAAATSQPGVPVRLDYRSAFEGYRAYQEAETRSWREANDEAGLLAGHVGQLKPMAASGNSAGPKPERAAPPSTPSSIPAASPAATAPPGSSPSPPMKPAIPDHGAHEK